MTTTVPTGSLRPASPRELAWLSGELTHWADEGILTRDQATTILGRYAASRRMGLATLVLTLGAAFVGIGLIWLVAANLDQLAPVWRFGLVAVVWLVVTVTAEWLAGRREHSGAIPSPVVGAARLLATLAFGGVVFQAAQSLQVAAYEPKLVGLWALGALIYAYAVRALMPLLAGTVLASVWFVWQVTWDVPSPFGAMLAFVAAGVVAVALASLHERFLPEFSAPWREAGVLLLLIALFFAAIPAVDTTDFAWSVPLAAGCALAALMAVGSLVVGRQWSRVEPAVAVLVGLVSVGLAVWQPDTDPDALSAGDWLHAGIAVAAYVATAAGVAALGVLRDSWRLTALATVALVVFTTFQSFAVFARILEGAWLFVILGLVFLATGYLADRARRRLAVSLEGEQ